MNGTLLGFAVSTDSAETAFDRLVVYIARLEPAFLAARRTSALRRRPDEQNLQRRAPT